MLITVSCLNRRKSDIENERLPPELINPDEVIPHFSNPSTPGESSNVTSPSYPFPTPHPYSSTAAKPAGANGTPRPGGMPFRPKHIRQQSLGTTTTSPSNRRRSIESTISLIREAAEGSEQDHPDLQHLADQLSNAPPKPAATSNAPTTGRWHGRGPSF